jgi:hypothetical protein
MKITFAQQYYQAFLTRAAIACVAIWLMAAGYAIFSPQAAPLRKAEAAYYPVQGQISCEAGLLQLTASFRNPGAVKINLRRPGETPIWADTLLPGREGVQASWDLQWLASGLYVVYIECEGQHMIRTIRR